MKRKEFIQSIFSSTYYGVNSQNIFTRANFQREFVIQDRVFIEVYRYKKRAVLLAIWMDDVGNIKNASTVSIKKIKRIEHFQV